MNCIFRLLCLFVVPCLMMADARAELAVLSPIDGLNRVWNYGPTYDPDDGAYDGPPGVEVSVGHGVSGGLYNDYDGRDSRAFGFVTDQLLLYDLRSLSGAVLSDVALRFLVDRVSVNNATDGLMDTGFAIKISGSNNSTLSDDDYQSPTIGWSGISALTGDYHNDPLIEIADVTTSFAKLLDQGFDYATVFLDISGPITTTGPLYFGLTTAPTLNVTETGIGPNASAVPEPSTIVQLGISIVGLGLYALRGKSRSR